MVPTLDSEFGWRMLHRQPRDAAPQRSRRDPDRVRSLAGRAGFYGILNRTVGPSTFGRESALPSLSAEVFVYVFEQTHGRDRCTIAVVGLNEKTQ